MSISVNKQGFTLIEATLAIAVLLIGILTMVQFFPFSLSIITESQDASIATTAALTKIEELLATAYDDLDAGTIESKQKLSNDPENFLFPFSRQTVVTYIDDDLNEIGTDQGLKKITVSVYWRSAITGSEQEHTISTIRASY